MRFEYTAAENMQECKFSLTHIFTHNRDSGIFYVVTTFISLEISISRCMFFGKHDFSEI